MFTAYSSFYRHTHKTYISLVLLLLTCRNVSGDKKSAQVDYEAVHGRVQLSVPFIYDISFQITNTFSSQQALMPELTAGQWVLGCEKRKKWLCYFFLIREHTF